MIVKRDVSFAGAGLAGALSAGGVVVSLSSEPACCHRRCPLERLSPERQEPRASSVAG